MHLSDSQFLFFLSNMIFIVKYTFQICAHLLTINESRIALAKHVGSFFFITRKGKRERYEKGN